jgi:hypothetical protein
MQLNRESAADLLRDVRLNLIKRSADGSLTMSADRWYLLDSAVDALRFRSEDREGVEAALLDVDLSDVESLSWDRLPKQHSRSQVRLTFRNGDVWTFSGLMRTEDSPESGPSERVKG